MNMQIPITLLEHFSKDEVVLFCGMDLSASPGNLPTTLQLAQELAQRIGVKVNDSLSLAEMAERYRIITGPNKHSLNTYILDRIDNPRYTPLPIHQLIASLPCQIIITTAWDNLFELALREARRPFVKVLDDSSISFTENKVALIKLRGSVEDQKSLAIAGNDYYDVFSQHPQIERFVKGLFDTKTILFLGFDLQDDDFKRLYHRISDKGLHKRQGYALQIDLDLYTVDSWREKGVQIIQSEPLEFLKLLRDSLMKKEIDENKLLHILTTRFNLSELRTLCFEMNIDYENLAGEGKVDKARELVAYLNRYHRLPELIDFGHRSRPDIDWNVFIILAIQSPPEKQNTEPEPYSSEILLPLSIQTTRPVKFKLQLGHLLDQKFETRVLESPMGEPVGNGRLPFSQEALVAILKALQTTPYQAEAFTSTQRNDLEQLGLLKNLHFVPSLLEKVGKTLYDHVFDNQNVREAFQMAKSQARTISNTVSFQLRFDENATELARYPWELLHDGRRTLLVSETIELTRYISYFEANTALVASSPLRLLYITARPNDLSKLPSDTESQTTRQALHPLENSNQLQVDDLSHATYDTLLDYLDDHTPHILHFDGHGRFSRQCHVCGAFYYSHLLRCETCGVDLPEPQGYLAFEKEDGTVNWISSQILGHLFGSSLRLAVLSACYSGVVRGETLFGGIGPALIQAGVPAVVATQLPITVGSANRFAKGFYRALARYESLATAVNAGRRRLFNTKEWFIPVLYLRSQDDEGHLFTKL